jgi:hypothetical protein
MREALRQPRHVVRRDDVRIHPLDQPSVLVRENFAGVDVATVRDFAGHSSVVETSRYVHATDSSRRRAGEVSAGLIGDATGAS